MLALYNNSPSESHSKLAYQVLRYIQSTIEYEIVIDADPPMAKDTAEVSVTMYPNASFGTDPGNIKSFSGHLLKINGSTLS